MNTGLFFRSLITTFLLILSVNQKVLGGDVPVATSIAPEIAIYRDETGLLGVREVSAASFQNAFQPVGSGLHLGNIDDALWIRVSVPRGYLSDGRWMLELSNAVMEDVRFYISNNDDFSYLQAGTAYPFNQRYFKTARPVFPLNSNQGEENNFFVRIYTDTAIITHVNVLNTEDMYMGMQRDSLVFGMLIGCGLLTIALSFVTWTWSRSIIVIFMGVTTLTFILGVLGRTGLLTQYAFPDAPFLSRHANTTTMGWFFAMLFYSINLFYRVAEVGRKYSYVLFVIVFINLVVPFVREAGYYRGIGVNLYYASWIVGFAVTNYAILYRAYFHGMRDYFSIILVPLFTLGFSLSPLVGLGVLSPTPLHEVAWIFAGFGLAFLNQMTISYEARNTLANISVSEERARHLKQLAENESALRQQQARFFAAVAHEVRTPLSAIRMGLDNLNRALVKVAPEVRQRIRRMQIATVGISDMIERHLQLQRILQSDFALRGQTVLIQDLVTRPEAVFREIQPLRELRVRLLVPNSAIYVDVDLVHSALLNLLTNAAKYSPFDSSIHLLVELRGHVYRFSVIDAGPGLDDDVLDTHFEVFWKRGKADNIIDFPSGMGIGLAFVNQIMQLHGGRLNYSRRNGLSFFSLDFPARV